MPTCSLTTGGDVFGDGAIFGTKLDRAAALAHPLLPQFWAMVDFLLLNDRLSLRLSGRTRRGCAEGTAGFRRVRETVLEGFDLQASMRPTNTVPLVTEVSAGLRAVTA